MDNDTKLSKEQIKNLVSEFKNSEKDGKVSTDAFLKKHLNENQRENIISALKNPEMLKEILSSQKAKDIMKALKGEKENEP